MICCPTCGASFTTPLERRKHLSAAHQEPAEAIQEKAKRQHAASMVAQSQGQAARKQKEANEATRAQDAATRAQDAATRAQEDAATRAQEDAATRAKDAAAAKAREEAREPHTPQAAAAAEETMQPSWATIHEPWPFVPQPVIQSISEVGGVLRQVLRAAPKGADRPKVGSTVLMHYIGYQLPTYSVFDSNMGKEGKLYSFVIGAEGVIPGFARGVYKMAVGELSRLTIPPDRAYGAEGNACAMIPPNTTLVFVVELLGIDQAEAVESQFNWWPSPTGASPLPPAIACVEPHLQQLPEQDCLRQFLQSGGKVAPGSEPGGFRKIDFGTRFGWDQKELLLVDWTDSDGNQHAENPHGWKPGGVWAWNDLSRWEQELGDEWVCARYRAPVFEDDNPHSHSTVAMQLKDYIQYMRVAERSQDTGCQAPRFYVNGWKLFNCVRSTWDPGFMDVPGVEDMSPYMMHRAHQASQMMGKPTGGNVDHHLRNLSKLFISPPGSITRMHFDRENAHGWFYQVHGEKLFVLVPPQDSSYMYGHGDESGHSRVDPLSPDLEKYPLYAKARKITIVLKPGQMLIIPNRWWHYAVSLTNSISILRNFWNRTNSPGNS